MPEQNLQDLLSDNIHSVSDLLELDDGDLLNEETEL